MHHVGGEFIVRMGIRQWVWMAMCEIHPFLLVIFAAHPQYFVNIEQENIDEMWIEI